MIEDELTPEQKFAAEDAETIVQRGLKWGRTSEDIVMDLVRLDWSQNASRALVARVMDDLRRLHDSPESRKQLIAEARRQIIGGVLVALLSVLIGVWTFLGAVAGAMPFVVALGLFFIGTIVAGRGLARCRLCWDTPAPPPGSS